MTDPDSLIDPDLAIGPDIDPNGWTYEVIAALGQHVDRDGRGEGYPVPDGQRSTTGQAVRRPVRSRTDPTTQPTTIGPAAGTITPAPTSCASPLPGAPRHPGGTGTADGMRSPTGQPSGEPAPVLFTPTQAAELLQVPESWLRRRAAGRQVPCTLLGKHLRFSRANLDQILTDATRPTATTRRTPTDIDAPPRHRGRPRARRDAHRPDPTRRTLPNGA